MSNYVIKLYKNLIYFLKEIKFRLDYSFKSYLFDLNNIINYKYENNNYFNINNNNKSFNKS